MTAPGLPAPAAAIAARLVRMLRREAALGPESVRFIDSTFSNPSAAEIARRLADESDPERDGLLELLLSPDEDHRVAIEPLLEPAADVDESEIARRLLRDVGRVRFRLPDGRGAFEVVLTAALARGFVAGLAIGRRIPAELRAALQPIADDRDRLRACVTLRHAGLSFTPARTGHPLPRRRPPGGRGPPLPRRPRLRARAAEVRRHGGGAVDVSRRAQATPGRGAGRRAPPGRAGGAGRLRGRAKPGPAPGLGWTGPLRNRSSGSSTGSACRSSAACRTPAPIGSMTAFDVGDPAEPQPD